MHVKVKIRNYPDYIRVDMIGDRTLSNNVETEAIQVWQTIAEECRTSGIMKVLLVSKISGKLSIFELYQITEQIVKKRGGIPQIAFVGGEDGSPDSIQFAEIVDTNRGLDARFFTDEISAIQWLK